MKALVFAAGLGTRLRPLTDTTPKPLLPVAGKPLLQWQLERMVAAGVTDIVINSAWLAEQIDAFVASVPVPGARVQVSFEPEGPYDTGGAIRHARPLLDEQPFLVVAGDIWTTMPLGQLIARGLGAGEQGCLMLVPNPEQHPDGDFRLESSGALSRQSGGNWYTYSGIALLRPSIINGFEEQRFPLREPLRKAADQGALAGQTWLGDWEDVGTPERYRALNQRLAVNSRPVSPQPGV